MKKLIVIFKLILVLGMAGCAMAVLLITFRHASATQPVVPAEITHSLEVVGQAGGSFKALAVQGDFLYAAIGPRLAVLNVTDNQPVLSGQTDVLPIDIQQLAIQGNYVYAASGQDGLYIFDVSDPSQPGVVGTLDIIGFSAGVAVTGTHAFISTDVDLQIVDVSQPDVPQAAGSYPAVVSDIALDGNVMYLARGDFVSILDISYPANPNLITNYDVPAEELEIGNYLLYVKWIANCPGPYGGYIDNGVLRILDISDPGVITEVYFSGDECQYPGFTQLRQMKLLENKLYGFETEQCPYPSYLHFGGMDVGNPISPTLTYTRLYEEPEPNEYKCDGGDFSVAGTGQRIYMASIGMLHIYNTDTSCEAGHFASWPADQVSVANEVAYVAARSEGLISVDVSAPENPMVLDVYTTTLGDYYETQPGRIHYALYGPYLYANLYSDLVPGRVDILDVSNSTNIQQVATADWYPSLSGIFNGFGYIFDCCTQLRAIDLGNPIQPVINSSSIPLIHSPSDLATAKSYAYITNLYAGLQIISIANPQDPFEVQQLDGPIPGLLMDNTDNAVYIFTDQALKIYDLSDPANPVETSNTPIAGLDSIGLYGYYSLKDIQVSGDYVYLAQTGAYTVPYSSTVRVFHSPDLISPVSQVISYTRPGSYFASIDVVEDSIYVASREDGLLILRHTATNPALVEQVYLPVGGSHAQSLPAHCTIAYRTHLENNGWLDWASDGGESGAAGQGLRIEALQVDLCNPPLENMGIVYQAHVQEIGWMDWVYDGDVAGTTGLSKRIEAIRFHLLNAPESYQLTYRVYVEGNGWTEWAYDGEIAGTTGQSKHIEAIQIEFVQP